MASEVDNTDLKALVAKASGESREPPKNQKTWFECDCCGHRDQIATNFENHNVWSCGRKFGCKVIVVDLPKPGQKGKWRMKNVQTGLEYEGFMLLNGEADMQRMTADEVVAEHNRVKALKAASFCRRNKKAKPSVDEMSYRQYQEKEWADKVGYWKDTGRKMLLMKHNPVTGVDEVVPRPDNEGVTMVDINERQYQTWRALGLHDRLMRDENAGDLYVDNMAALGDLLSKMPAKAKAKAKAKRAARKPHEAAAQAAPDAPATDTAPQAPEAPAQPATEGPAEEMAPQTSAAAAASPTDAPVQVAQADALAQLPALEPVRQSTLDAHPAEQEHAAAKQQSTPADVADPESGSDAEPAPKRARLASCL